MIIRYSLLAIFISLYCNIMAQTSYNVYASDYMIFSPSNLNINLGDTVYFENLNSHNVVEVSEESYYNNVNISNGGFELYTDDYIVFDEIGTYYYVCTPHVEMGMKGIINVNLNSISGQWYADVGDYLQINADSFFIYIFESEECYEYEEYFYELDNNTINLYDNGEIMNINLINATQNSFSLAFNNDTINLVSTSFNIFDWEKCDSTDCYDDNNTIISIFGDFFVNDCNSLMYYLSLNYNFSLEQSCNWDGGDMFNLDSNLVMDVCECTCEEDAQIITWKCFSGSCFELNNGTGEYNSLEECELNCLISDTTWKCNNGFCVEVFDSSGEYMSLDECENSCFTNESYNCIDNICNNPMDGSGEFLTLNDCEQVCQNMSSISYNINDVNIFPNPSSNIFNLKFNIDAETEILVTNVLGEQVYFESSKSIGEYNTQIDLSDSTKGIYNLTIKSNNIISNHKLVLQ